MLLFVFFFFKQKTAYEMRISDWSSDVCSSDLIIGFEQQTHVQLRGARCTRDTVAAPAQHVPAQMRPVEAAATDAEDDAFAERCASKIAQRSEERRVGKECVSTCRSRGSP